MRRNESFNLIYFVYVLEIHSFEYIFNGGLTFTGVQDSEILGIFPFKFFDIFFEYFQKNAMEGTYPFQ